MVTVSIDGDRLTVALQGFQRILALRRGFDIPLDHVVSAVADPSVAQERKGIRSPGTYLPKVITAGTYFRKGTRNFWYVRQPENAVVIELRSERYQRLILEVADPDATVARLEAAIH